MKRQLKTSVDLFDFETACGSGTGVELGLVLRTLGVQLSSVLSEVLEPNPLPEQMKELLQSRTGRFVVVHLLLAALPCHAVHHPHLPLETELQRERG